MSFEARKEAALKELKEAGIWEINSKPPALLFLWWLGLNVRPFHYNSFFRNTLFMGLGFTAFWAPLCWFLQLYSFNTPLTHFVTTVVVVGCVFGLAMGINYKFTARKLPKRQFQMAAIVVFLGGIYVWAELAVGVFSSLGS